MKLLPALSTSPKLQSKFFGGCILATVLYVLQAWFKFELLPGPPWPSPVMAAFLITGTNLAGYLIGATLFADSSYRRCKVTIATAAMVGTISTVAYICFASLYIVAVDDPSDIEVIGIRLQPDIEQLVKSNPSAHTPRELILDFHDPESVWMPSSVRLNRAVLFITWLLSGLAFMFILGTAAAMSQRKKSKVSTKKAAQT